MSLASATDPSTAHRRPPPAASPSRAAAAVKIAGLGWLSVALLGQLAFGAYVFAVYGGGLWSGQLERWNAATPRGHVPGEWLGNLVFGSHMAFTLVVIFGGLVQLLPVLRRRAPALHRWNGRVYLIAAVLLALGGTVLMLTRGTVGSVAQQAGTVLNGVVILACAAMAWRHARARRLAEHRRWALRLFVAVSGVWFFRIGLMAWLLLHRAPVGFDPETFTGPTLLVLAYAQFLLPLAVLELFFRAQAPQAGATRRWATAGLLGLLTLLTALGITGAVLMMWWPRM